MSPSQAFIYVYFNRIKLPSPDSNPLCIHSIKVIDLDPGKRQGVSIQQGTADLPVQPQSESMGPGCANK
jgi:hypothetical protein